MIQQLNDIHAELEFSTLDYAAGREPFATKAIALYSKRNCFCAKQCIDEVSRELEGIYKDAKSVSVEATVIPNILRTGDHIGIIIGES